MYRHVTAPLIAEPVLLGRAQPPHEPRDSGADLVGTVRLDEMHSDVGLGQVGPCADELADAAANGRVRFGIGPVANNGNWCPQADQLIHHWPYSAHLRLDRLMSVRAISLR